MKRLAPRRRAVPSMPGGLSSLAGFVLAVGAVGLLSCSEHRGPTAPGPEKEVSFQTVYAGGSGIAAFETVAIRNDAQWRQFWTRVQEGGSPASPLPSVDFRSSMLLAAAMVGDGCSSIEITDVTIDRLSLRVTVHHQDHGCACPAVIEKIVHIVRIPRYSQPVDWFVPPPVQLPCAQGR